MALKEVVTLICDLCGKEDGVGKTQVSEHTFKLDRRASRVLDSCEKCWSPYQDMMEKLIGAGRTANRDRRRLASVS